MGTWPVAEVLTAFVVQTTSSVSTDLIKSGLLWIYISQLIVYFSGSYICDQNTNKAFVTEPLVSNFSLSLYGSFCDN